MKKRTQILLTLSVAAVVSALPLVASAAERATSQDQVSVTQRTGTSGTASRGTRKHWAATPSPSASTATAAGTPSPSSTSPTAAALSSTGTRHYVANVGSSRSAAAALGYNLFDMGPDRSLIDALPDGDQALVWLGNIGKSGACTPTYSFADFTAAVDRLAGDPKVYGYFIADEPHPGACPDAVADIRERADYIRAHAPAQKSFIVVLDGSNQCGGTYGCEYKALAPANSHVDLIGLDPYPCNVNNTDTGCTFSKIPFAVSTAVANGIPTTAIVPVFQVFGQTCNSGSHYYRLPSATELTTMLADWAAAVPSPAFDYSYSWGNQSSSCPTLVDANGSNGYPDLQSVMRAHNG